MYPYRIQRVSLPNAGIVEHIVENHGQPILDDAYANYGVRVVQV